MYCQKCRGGDGEVGEVGGLRGSIDETWSVWVVALMSPVCVLQNILVRSRVLATSSSGTRIGALSAVEMMLTNFCLSQGFTRWYRRLQNQLDTTSH